MQICRDIYAKGVKGVARMRLLLGDIRYESANYLKAPNNFVSYEAGARFAGDFSPLSFKFP